MRPAGRICLFAAFVIGVFSAAAKSTVAVLKPGAACAASERAYASSLAGHLVRWLKDGGVAADLCDGSDYASALSGRRIVYLPMCSEPTKAQTAALSHYIAKGGKVVSFYSQSAVLAGLMGVRPGIYRRSASGTYARMAFVGKSVPAGSPSAIEHSTPNIFSAQAIPGRSQVLAMWQDRKGRPVGEAAIISSSAGWWITHVFTADGDEDAKRRFVLSIAGVASPGVWNAAAWKAKADAKKAGERAYGAAQHRRPGEIHAVWDQSGQGLFPGDWPRTMRLLAANRITDVFVNVAGAGFAHYASAVLPRSQVYASSGDQLAAAIAAAKGTGIRVHAWMMCFTLTKSSPARFADCRRRGWCLYGKDGKALEYLDPSNPDVRALMISVAGELARYSVHGIHLDFVRWYENVAAAERTPNVLARFKAEKPGAFSRRRFCDWRSGKVASFVSAVRSKVRRPGLILSAAVLGSYPSCVDSVGQDWEAWLEARLVDWAVPMDYTTDNLRFASYVARHGRTRAQAAKVIAGIGVTANESRLDAVKVIDQVNLARRAGLAGVAFFDLDSTLADSILPILRLGMF